MWFRLQRLSDQSSQTCNTNNKYSSVDNSLIENLNIYTIQNKDEFGQFSYNYDTKKRLSENNPTLKCEESDSYESYVGLLSVDELIFNGNNGGIDVENNVSTLSLSHYESEDNLNFVYTYKLEEVPENESLAINPIITLVSGVNYVKGNGTLSNPYEIN